MRILLADDSRIMRLLIKRALRQAGQGSHDIVEAENGLQAKLIIETAPPDLILCDWNMPEINGYDLLVQLRGAGVHIPFGFITSETTESMKQKALAAGALFLVTKPFTTESLAEGLEPYLK